MPSPAVELRAATAVDEPYLRHLLRLALFVAPGDPPVPDDVVDSPALATYVAGFGTDPNDVGVVASVDGEAVGGAWVRRLAGGYGWVDDRTPELSIAVEPAWRGRGVGTALLSRLIDDLCGRVPSVSLSCDDRNPAMALYRRFGFQTVRHDPPHSEVMCRRLPGVGQRMRGRPERRRTRTSAYVVVIEDDALLACRLCGPALNAGWWTLPGGGLDPGESPVQAAARELEEETGLVGEVGELLVQQSYDLRWYADDGVAEVLTVEQAAYAGRVTGGELRHEVGNTTNMAAWLPLDGLHRRALTPIAVRGLQAGLRLEGEPRPEHVVAAHVLAVRSRDLDLMVVDHDAAGEVLRAGNRYRGTAGITAAYRGVSSWLGSGWLDVEAPTVAGATVTVRWRVWGGPAHGAGGEATFEVIGGRIRSSTDG